MLDTNKPKANPKAFLEARTSQLMDKSSLARKAGVSALTITRLETGHFLPASVEQSCKGVKNARNRQDKPQPQSEPQGLP
jgi:DNA-binding XRE family transcriptional regulator